MKRILIAALILLAGPPSFAGFEANNGTDDTSPTSGSAWFLGADRIVTYCISIAPEFSTTPNPEGEVEAALETWVQYARAARIQFREPDFALALTFKQIACDGSEDLAFLLGAENDAVNQWRKQFENPVGFAERYSIDPVQGWSRGVVWIAKSASQSKSPISPDWSRPWRLRALLLHEIGHVFGCAHTPDTIMRADLPVLLKADDSPETHHRLKNIDHETELVYKDQAFEVSGTFGGRSHIGPIDGLFRSLTGTPPVGPVTAKIKAGQRREPAFFSIADRKNEYKFFLTFEDQSTIELGHLEPTSLEPISSVFRAVRVGSDGVYRELTDQAARVTYFGLLHNARDRAGSLTEEPIPILMERNGSRSFIRLSVLDKYGSHLVFESDAMAPLEQVGFGRGFQAVNALHERR